LVSGLRTFRVRSEGLPAPVRAAVISFGFVYIHPFVDGNGRLHRLLLHESLALDGYTDPGVILPFSAAMLREPAEYDRVLETLSRAVEARVRYNVDESQDLVIQNPQEAQGVWRYPDLTPHVEYILDLIAATVTTDLPDELQTLSRIDQLTQAIRGVVDLPDPKLSLLLALLLQNGGKLASRKRAAHFSELTDAEIAAIEKSYVAAFGPTTTSRT
jgi:hypothetical protein